MSTFSGRTCAVLRQMPLVGASSALKVKGMFPQVADPRARAERSAGRQRQLLAWPRYSLFIGHCGHVYTPEA